MLSKALSTMNRKKMSSVDTAWLRMDSAGNLMMIVGVAMFDKPVSIALFKAAIAERFVVHGRFRSRVVADAMASWWEEQEIDLDQHIIHTRLPSAKPNNKPALEQLVGELSAIPLDPSKPLWQMHLVDNCIGEDGKKRQALITRIHHCIADGIALVSVFMSLFDNEPDAPPRAPSERAAMGAQEHSDNPWEQFLQPLTAASVKAINLSSAMLTKYLGMLGNLNKLTGQLTDAGQMAAQVTVDAVKLMAMPDDSDTRLKGKPCGKKNVAWSEPLPLAEVKAIGKAFSCSVNDVLMACVAGAIRSYLAEKGDTLSHDCEMRAMVPVNLRKPGEEQKLGNAFGTVPLVLPVGIEDPVRRLYEVRRRMDDLKGSYTALVAMAVLGVMGATPRQVQSEILNYFAKKATVVMSNVPGPQTPLYLAGSKLDQVMFWVPQSGDVGVGVSILSYNGGVQFGIVTDDAMASDPQEIINRFAPEFEKLVLLTLMSEWA